MTWINISDRIGCQGKLPGGMVLMVFMTYFAWLFCNKINAPLIEIVD